VSKQKYKHNWGVKSKLARVMVVKIESVASAKTFQQSLVYSYGVSIHFILANLRLWLLLRVVMDWILKNPIQIQIFGMDFKSISIFFIKLIWIFT